MIEWLPATALWLSIGSTFAQAPGESQPGKQRRMQEHRSYEP